MSNVVRFPARRPAAGPAARRVEPLWRAALGHVLRDARLDRGERIADVAARAGVAPQYLSEIERGRKDPSSEVLAAVSGALDLTTGEVATRAAGHLARASAGGGPVCLAA